MTITTANFSYLKYIKELPLDTHQMIIAPKGSGKTYTLLRQLKDFDIPIKWLTNRRLLLGKIVEDARVLGLPIVSQRDDSFSLATTNTISCCESFCKNVIPKTPFILVIDEVDQVLHHLVSSTTMTATYRVHAIEKLVQMVNTAERVYFMSADILPSLSTAIANTFPTCDWKVNEFKSDNPITYPCHIYSRVNDNSNKGADVYYLIDRLLRNEAPLLVFNNKRDEMTGFSTKQIQALYPDKKVLVVDSETFADPKHDAHKVSHNPQVLSNYDLVIFTACVVSGLSIDFDYFKSVLVVTDGSLSASEITQVSYRVRFPIPRYFLANQIGRQRPDISFSEVKQMLSASLNYSSSVVNHADEIASAIDAFNTSVTSFSLIAATLIEEHSISCAKPLDSLRQQLERENLPFTESECLKVKLPKELRERLDSIQSAYGESIAAELDEKQPTATANYQDELTSDFSDEPALIQRYRALIERTGIPYSKLKEWSSSEHGLLTSKLEKKLAQGQIYYLRSFLKGETSARRVSITSMIQSPKIEEFFSLGKPFKFSHNQLLRFIGSFNFEMFSEAKVPDDIIEQLLDYPSLFQFLVKSLCAKSLIKETHVLYPGFEDYGTDTKQVCPNRFKKHLLGAFLESVGLGKIEHSTLGASFDTSAMFKYLQSFHGFDKSINKKDSGMDFAVNNFYFRVKSCDEKFYQRIIDSDRTDFEKAQFVRSSREYSIFNRLNEHYEFSNIKRITRLSLDKLAKFRIPNPCFIDTETYSPVVSKIKKGDALSRQFNRIRLIQLGDNSGNIWYIELPGRDDSTDVSELIIPFLNRLKESLLVFHNAMFDMSSLASSYGVIFDNVYDTMLAMKTAFSCNDAKELGLKGFGLKPLCEDFFGDVTTESEAQSDWGLPLTDSQIRYACFDINLTRNLYKLSNVLLNRPYLLGNPSTKKQLTYRLSIELGCLTPYVESETRGIYFNKEFYQMREIAQSHFDANRNYFKEKYGASHNSLNKVIAPMRERFDIRARKAKDWLDLAVQTKDSEVVELARSYRLCKDLEIYVNRCETAINSLKGNYFHQEISTATGAGRAAYSSGSSDTKALNLNSIPKAVAPALKEIGLKPLRNLCSVAPGNTWVDVDLGGAHLKIATHFAKCPITTEILNTGRDSHSAVALELLKILHKHDFEVSYEGLEQFLNAEPTDELVNQFKSAAGDKNSVAYYLRQAAKLVYAAINGGNPKTGVKNILFRQYPVLFPQAMVDEFPEAFKVYGNLFPTIDEMICNTKLAENRGFVGKTRGAYSSEVESIGYFFTTDKKEGRRICSKVWQFLEAMIMKLAIAKAYDKGAKILVINHDSMGVECSEDTNDYWVETIHQIMHDCGRVFCGEVHPGAFDKSELYCQENSAEFKVYKTWH